MRQKKTLIFLGAVLLSGAAPVFSGVQQETTTKSLRQTSASHAGAHKTSHKRSKTRRVRGQKAPSADRIREIQAALAREGAYAGKPNGKWDAPSVEAMKRYQTARHLPVTGKFDARSLQELGLGSEVAGRAAPLPLATAVPTPNRP